VAVPVERAWAVLTTRAHRSCMPGAQLREVQGDEYRGSVKVKVGPITTSYDGIIRISELDHSAHLAVLKAEGRETRGQGNVAAEITATLYPPNRYEGCRGDRPHYHRQGGAIWSRCAR